MNIKNYNKILIPNIIKNFKCVSCGECCRNKWRIDIDKKTYEKTKFKLEENKEKIENYIEIDPETKKAYTKFDNGYCKFITSERLCRVHRDLGWDCLSNTCKVYPRILNVTPKGMEVSLTFSCREAARLLLSKEIFEVEEIEKENFFLMEPSKVNFLIPKNELRSKIGFYYFELEKTLIDILKNRESSLGNRLEEIRRLIITIKYNDCKDINLKELKEKNLKNLLNEKELENKNSKEEFIFLIKEFIKIKKDISPGFQSELEFLLKNSCGKREINDYIFFRATELVLDKKTLNRLLEQWEPEYDIILENYSLVHVFSKEWFKNMYFSLSSLYLLITFLKLKILLYTDYLQRKLTDEELVEIISTLDNDFRHNEIFFKTSYDYLLEKKYNGLELKETLKIINQFF